VNRRQAAVAGRHHSPVTALTHRASWTWAHRLSVFSATRTLTTLVVYGLPCVYHWGPLHQAAGAP